MTITGNEATILTILGEKGPIDIVDCARLADLKEGLTGATLHSLVNRGLATENSDRKGLTRKKNGTFSITPSGHDALRTT